VAENLPGEAKPEDPRPVFIVRKIRRKDRARAAGTPGPWALRWRDPPEAGLLRQKQIGPMSERLAEKHRVLWQCELNGFRADTDDDLLWRDFVARLLADKAAHLAHRSLRDLRQELARFTAAARPRLLGEVTKLMVREYLTRRLAATSLATARKSCRVLSQAFGWAVAMELAGANPCQGQPWRREERRLPDAYSLAETRRLLAALRSEATWLWAAVGIAARWGPRAGELATVRPADVDFRDGLITIRGTKTHTERCIPLDRESAGLLHELRHRSASIGILWGPCDRPFSLTRFRLTVVAETRRLLASVGLGSPAQPLQKLRRTALTNLRRRGIDPETAAQILGHSAAVGSRWYDGRDPREFAEGLEEGLRSV